jgi:hypothetical protein
MNAIIRKPGSGLARPVSSKGNDIALVNETIMEFTAPLKVSKNFIAEWCTVSGHSIGTVCLPKGRIETPSKFPGLLDEATRIHRYWLRHYAEIEAVSAILLEVLVPLNREVDHATAVRMVGALFAALGKKKSSDENETLLLACADMFSPLSETIATVTGLWKPVDRHPLILALAVKQLITCSVFTSAAELCGSMAKVRKTIEWHVGSMQYLSNIVERADQIVFDGDRAAWNAAHAAAGNSAEVVAEMQKWWCLDEEGYEDDDGNAVPPSPRWQAFADLIKAKSSEHCSLEKAKAAVVKLPPRRAACTTKPAKRTRAVKQTENGEP